MSSDTSLSPTSFHSQSDVTSDLDPSPSLSIDTHNHSQNNLESSSYETDCFRPKIFNDPIHGSIELNGLLVKFIDTPQFQRLRRLKQLGASYFVFTGAAHNRFEHSVGTCYVAGELLTSLKLRQPELEITDKDVLCVQIAALCHDIGHGPFSHMFEEVVHELRPDKKWTHELASIRMIDYIIEENNLKQYLDEANIDDNDRIFIKEIIFGPLDPTNKIEDWPYKGRTKDKSYLYEIVSNKLTGIDVDKFDYIARDSYHLGTRNSFDHIRFIKFYRVVPFDDGTKHLCLRDKEVKACYEIYRVRDDLHRRAYQHPIVKGIDLMIKEALKSASEILQFTTRNGEKVSLVDTVDEMFTLNQIDDHILTLINYSNDPRMKKSQEIIKNIECRNIYRYLANTTFTAKSKDNKFDWRMARNEVLEICKQNPAGKYLTEDDLVVQCVALTCGDRGADPIENMWFYTKDFPNRGTKLYREQVSSFLPENFVEFDVRVYSKIRDPNICRIVRLAFIDYCATKKLNPPKGSNLWTSFKGNVNQKSSQNGY